ncbi:MAG: class I tRNA ligase family protein, partial [Verrucomicrobiota bacterium]
DLGMFTDEVGVPELVGEHVHESNIPIIKILAGKEALVGKEKYLHSYPHCWRSKTPIIFRSVPQFFIRIDELRKTALEEIDKVDWLPHWGRNRIYGTVESRPDWCISRQRTWGVPLPVFYLPGEETPEISAELARKVAVLTEEGGTNLWFEKDDAWWAEKLGLPEGTKRCTDTLDVWIDSGSSHVAVMDRRTELSCPADLYLEATDQHRGWFQSSLMLSTAIRDSAPYKSVMTHGFVVRRATKEENEKRRQEGKEPVKNLKVSKSDESGGKPMNAAHFYNKFGADIVRLWAGSVDWQNEVPFSEDIFKQTAEPYRRFRNTLRILLANLNDFDPAENSVAAADLPLADRWIMERLSEVTVECRAAYESFEFRKVFNTLNQFCANDLSAFYVDLTKDRMYCDAPDSLRRRATQTTMHAVFNGLVKLIAPILAFTADEAWEYAGNESSVHLETFPEADPTFADGRATAEIEQLTRLRDLAQVAIDAAIKGDQFKKRERASVTFSLPADDPARKILLEQEEEALEFLMVSTFEVEDANGEASASVSETDYSECPRCRRSLPVSVETGLCDRCTVALKAVG